MDLQKQFTDKDQQLSGSEGDDDVEAALKKEASDVKASERRLRRFHSIKCGANSTVFTGTLGKVCVLIPLRY